MNQPQASNSNCRSNPTVKSSLKEIFSLVLIICFALLVRIIVFEPFFIPSGSMKTTLLEKDYIISTKYNYGYSKYSLPFNPPLFTGRVFASAPQRGDIIIFRPPNNMSVRYVKRLIGLPGDSIQIKNGQVFINNMPVDREYVGKHVDEDGTLYNQYVETLPNNIKYFVQFIAEKENSFNKIENTDIFYVPEGHYFFMGDNRDQSEDSRRSLGVVPFDNFIAKAQFIFFSTEKYLWLENGSIYERLSNILPWIKSIRCKRLFKKL